MRSENGWTTKISQSVELYNVIRRLSFRSLFSIVHWCRTNMCSRCDGIGIYTSSFVRAEKQRARTDRAIGDLGEGTNFFLSSILAIGYLLWDAALEENSQARQSDSDGFQAQVQKWKIYIYSRFNEVNFQDPSSLSVSFTSYVTFGFTLQCGSDRCPQFRSESFSTTLIVLHLFNALCGYYSRRLLIQGMFRSTRLCTAQPISTRRISFRWRFQESISLVIEEAEVKCTCASGSCRGQLGRECHVRNTRNRSDHSQQ